MTVRQATAVRWYPNSAALLHSEERVARFLSHAFDAVAVYSEGAIRQLSGRLPDALGVDLDSFVGRSLGDLVVGGIDLDAALAANQDVFRTTLRRPDGQLVPAEVLLWRPDPAAGDTRLVAIRLLRPLAAEFGPVVAAKPDPTRLLRLIPMLPGAVLTVNSDDQLVAASTPSTAEGGALLGELLGTRIDDILPSGAARAAAAALDLTRESGIPHRSTCRFDDGDDSISLELTVRPRRMPGGDPAWDVVFSNRPADSHHLRELEARSSQLAEVTQELQRTRAMLAEARIRIQRLSKNVEELGGRDAATGLPSRQSTEDQLRREWRNALRSGSELSLMLIEPDYLVPLEQALGQAAREDALRSVGLRIAQQTRRPRDFVGHFGDQSFAVVLSDTTLVGARERGEAARQAVRDLAIDNPGAFGRDHLTISVGIASTTPTQRSFQKDLVELARKQLALAAADGGDQVKADQLSMPDGHGVTVRR